MPQKAGGFSALPSGADPGTGTLKNGKVKLFSADRGHPFQLLWEGCLVGLGWSAFPCCAYWLPWLAGPGSLSLLVAVPAFHVFLPASFVADLSIRVLGAPTQEPASFFWSGTPSSGEA